jgi:hypothetical protein
MNSAADHHSDTSIRDSSIILIRSKANSKQAGKLRFGWRNAVADDTTVLDLEGWHEDSLVEAGSKTLASIISARLGVSSETPSGDIRR